MWPALVANHISTIADTVDGETMTVHTAEMPVCSVLMLMVLLTFVWRMAVLIMAELKFITTANGAQSVMISGISMTLMWFAVSLVSPVRPRHHGAIRDLHSRIRIRIRFNAKMGAYTQGWGRAYKQINFVCFQVRMGLQLGRVVNEGRGAAYKQKFKVSFCNQDNISRVFLRLWCHERRFL